MSLVIASTRNAADEEARAEVDVLNSRLEKTTQLTKKIQASLGRLEDSGKSVRDVVGPLGDIDNVISAIEKLRQPADSKNDEEQIIRAGPDKIGLSNYLASMKRLNKSLADMKASNLRANQQTMTDLTRLVKFGNNLLESHFQKLVQGETPPKVEVLNFITKDKLFPVLSQDKFARLGLINAYMASSLRQTGVSISPQDSSVGKVYVDIRSPYLLSSLSNLATASVNTAKKKTLDAVYRAGANAIGSYATAMEGMFLAEYDNICNIFTRDEWGPLFQAVCQASIAELARTLRELNLHVKAHLNTDCFLAYEITEVMANLSGRIETRTGELKAALAAALKPVRETAKASFAEVLEETRRKAIGLQTLPPDGAPIPLVSEAMQRLQNMAEFLGAISGIMISIGDGGWRSSAMAKRAGDRAPSLASFDIGADGKEIFVNYCIDTIDTLLTTLSQKATALLRGKSTQGVFLGNCVVIIERMVRDSDLLPLLEPRMAMLDQWRKKATALYTDTCKDISTHLFDVIHTNRAQRPTSSQADSASILKGLSTKDRDSIKSKFQAFNTSFDEMVARHRTYSMEREVRQMFARAVQQMLEPLYNRFWDRYHEIDKGKGKHVKYDKSSIAAVFMSLY
ncbi:Exocyst complex protein EXO70 [Scedosporium apiospermum]|uniref:Exocyst complex protein EXO70 n=1 Tax=Pseudallescheria apiosperma TaxID=563466 RepID=A0A084GGP8_PSEDA|nr:Exocyst complex protein EXO70 [Scedosporium apiospermum]KEZ46510.1 Exocyst complex protein EXO70 [Scedosporium apiospermum]